MRKFLMGFLWFLGLWLGASMICAFILGFMAFFAGVSGVSENAGDSARVSAEKFGEKYGSVIMTSAMVVAVLGSAMGVLPGTRKKTKPEPPITFGKLPLPLPADTVTLPKEIFIGRDGQRFGPFTADEIKNFLLEGRLLIADLAWYEGAPRWVPVAKIPFLNTPLTPPSPPPVPPPPLPQESV
jgi:hypothetical protein